MYFNVATIFRIGLICSNFIIKTCANNQENEIDTIVNGSLEYEFQKAVIIDEGNTDKFRKSNIKWLPFDSKWEWVIDKIMSQVTEANNTIWNFELKSIIDNIQ